MRHRAAALPPEERRAAIIAATVPLLLSHGAAITTRQIAEAAGIAEGTIFRVFPDKDSLIEAAIETAFDDAPVDEALRAIDRSLALEQRLAAAVDIIELRVTRIWQLMTAVGMTKIPDKGPGTSGRRGPPDLTALAALFEPDLDRLAMDPSSAAHLLRGMTFANFHPAFARPFGRALAS